MAAAVLTVGDYELQVSLSEALCRLTPRKDREQRANQWFSSHDISSASVTSETKTLRWVYTFPAAERFSTPWRRQTGSILDRFQPELRMCELLHRRASGCQGHRQSSVSGLNNPISTTTAEEVFGPDRKRGLSVESCFKAAAHWSQRGHLRSGATRGGGGWACDEPVMEPKSDLTCGITAAFNTFKTELEQHFTSCWQNAEAEVLQSLKECQQHVTSLLTAVHQHRLALLHTFQISVSHQLNRLEENSTSLNSMNSQILGFFQAEMTRLGLFCEEHLQRLKSLESEASGTEHLSGQ
ncbi:Synaptonemal complex protein 2-like [Larimichthys crocea]|uniref:Synaptonemal complex protein 2-like n=1 Tax=Larimichthys crocea TaxID=215358 RepID=A0A6G0HKP2_LARCR|nr:Synaptonemal complex protein 2-like [Larimichthys crocea]